MLWTLAGIAGLLSVAPSLDRAVSNDEPTAAADGYVISRAADGQFYANGQVGGATIRFLVDPDAEKVLIARADADRLGIATVQVDLTSIAIGPTLQTDVTAQVSASLPVSVIGKAYLSRLAVADVRGDRLILR